jgi:hypothetical protein
MAESKIWSIAARFTTTGEAEAAGTALDAARIRYELADENIIRVNWGMSQAVGGVKVLVRDDDLERAREIIFTPAADPIVEPVIEPIFSEAPTLCPACGSLESQPVPRLRIFLLMAAVFIAIGAVAGQEMLAMIALIAVAAGVLLMPLARCSQCGHRWSPPPRERRVEAPPPDPADMIETPCPRCGSFEVYQINDRPLKAIPLLIPAMIIAVLPVWLLSAKRQCDSCGLKLP